MQEPYVVPEILRNLPENFEIYTLATSMMGLGFKKIVKYLIVQSQGIFFIRGTPYDKQVEFTIQ